ncbi:bacteriohemerythrin [Clostridiisalibacter paucivorans]|uniref:bacteriohemerythrin n=1 Tax=Clostridiisalibacter paucivorans TaxID=408753 RepID=UPI00047C0960|nr:bacteriohemerythrin [Clostridiisalibacter paucivorans]
MLFKWKDKYTTNVGEIDKQHRKLFEIGSRLYYIMILNDDIDHYDEIMAIVEELKNYTIYHFDYEEKLMESHGYEDLAEHKKKHTIFVNKIKEVSAKDIDEQQKGITMDIIMFIADWIEKHILGTDMKYKEFFNSNGVY